MAKAKKTKQPDGGLNVLNREYEPDCPLSKLQLHPDNARQGDIGNLHSSFDINGFYGAVIAQVSTGRILAGNHRYIAATQKHVESIPVIWVDCEDNVALRILVSDNRASDLADYSQAALAEVLERIKLDDTDLGFLGTGWDEEAYQNLLSDLEKNSGIFAPEKPEDNWKEMPEFHQSDLLSKNALIVNFKSQEDRQSFARLIEQSLTEKTRSIWFPAEEKQGTVHLRYMAVNDDVSLQ